MHHKNAFWKRCLMQLTILTVNLVRLEHADATPDQLPQCYTIPDRFLEGNKLYV